MLFAAPRMRLATGPTTSAFMAAPAPASDIKDSDVKLITSAQDGSGTFDPKTVEQVVFSSTSIPELPAYVSSLNGHDDLKSQIWRAICAIAWF